MLELRGRVAMQRGVRAQGLGELRDVYHPRVLVAKDKKLKRLLKCLQIQLLRHATNRRCEIRSSGCCQSGSTEIQFRIRGGQEMRRIWLYILGSSALGQGGRGRV